MIFCKNCFRDVQIRSIIESINLKGNCPICGSRNTALYDTDKNNELNDLFNELITIYTPQNLLPTDYPLSEIHMLADELKNEWNIFSVSITSSQIYELVKILSTNLYNISPKLFDTPVGVPEKYDVDYLGKHSILKGYEWNDFVESIKYDNRFHTKIINTEKLQTYLSYLKKDYNADTILYRGRLYNCDNRLFNTNEMGAPKNQYAKEGRANSAGIRRLYLADCKDTCIHEIRAGAFDNVAIGKFKLKENISIIDFKQINDFSPFNGDFDFLEYLINKPILYKIDKEMGRAVRSSDNHLDYIPTQYLCDFIKTLEYQNDKKYSGVEYSSTLNPDGYNLAIFYPELFECISVTECKIKSLEYNCT